MLILSEIGGKSFLKTMQKSVDKCSLVVYHKYIAREHKSIQGGTQNVVYEKGYRETFQQGNC